MEAALKLVLLMAAVVVGQLVPGTSTTSVNDVLARQYVEPSSAYEVDEQSPLDDESRMGSVGLSPYFRDVDVNGKSASRALVLIFQPKR